MKKLFDEKLSGREFGSDVLHVPGLLEWAKSKGFHLVTDPALDGYDYAQIEALLCEIERNAYAQSHKHAAVKMVRSQATKPMLPAMTEGLDAETAEAFEARLHEAPVFLDGANAHYLWRAILKKAIAAGELVPLDSTSFLPATKQSAPAAKVEAGTSPSKDIWVQARAIADECFDHDTQMNCRDALATRDTHGRITGGYCFRVMIKMRERGISGSRGIIDNPATIMREALQGGKWWANKSK